MNNIKRIYLTAVALGACAVSFGQNLNPTVEVTNTYEGDPSHLQKPLSEMAVPDSLLRFDLDFNYEVFENPYDASYSFKPYMLNVKPGRDAWRGKTLYLKAGAGYTLHPQLDFVYSPEMKGPFQLSIYANHRSYFGKYYDMIPFYEETTKIDQSLVKNNTEGPYEIKGDGSYKGHDALTRAGFEARYSWETGAATFGIGYYGIHTKDSLLTQSYNAVDVQFGLRSYNTADKSFYYDAVVSGRFGKDNYDYKDAWSDLGISQGTNKLSESIMTLKANFGPSLWGHKFLIGVEGEYASYSDLFKLNYGLLGITPKYVLEKGKWRLNLGVRLQFFNKHFDDVSNPLSSIWVFGDDATRVSLDMHASFAPTNNFQMYADVTGGTKLNTFSSILEENHHFNPLYASADGLYDNDIVRIDGTMGFRGTAGSIFKYDLNFGAASYKQGLQDYAWYTDGTRFHPSYVSSEYTLYHANALLGLNMDSFRIDASLHFRHTEYEDESTVGIAKPKFTGNIRGVYDLTSRIWMGADMQFATQMKGKFLSGSGGEYGLTTVKIPGWFDLGLMGGYQFNRKVGFWLESGNLLLQKIQKNPFYAEKGLWVTAGITLNL
jgi:hypothetical protein